MINPSHSAFPATEYYDERPIGGSSGLTKRELFSAMALSGMLSNEKACKEASELKGGAIVEVDILASIAVTAADALIKALSQS